MHDVSKTYGQGAAKVTALHGITLMVERGSLVAVIGWLRGNSLNGGISALGNVPVGNLLVLLIGTPVAAAAIAWLLAGRRPAALAHQAIE